MHDFPPDDPVLRELFDPYIPNSPALWAVLKGNYSGTAVVDNKQNPSECVLRTDAALTYFSNQAGQYFLNRAITHFVEAGPVWLVWPRQTSLYPPESDLTGFVNRLEFYACDPESEILNNLRRQMPDGHRIQNIDEQLLERCEWRAEMEFYAGSMSNFLTHGIGLCLMRGNEIVVEAYASALGKTTAEIGAITHTAERGRGLAAIACAYLIEVCRQRGYQTYWSCNADHTASIRVAQKLGFQQDRAYRIYTYDMIR